MKKITLRKKRETTTADRPHRWHTSGTLHGEVARERSEVRGEGRSELSAPISALQPVIWKNCGASGASCSQQADAGVLNLCLPSTTRARGAELRPNPRLECRCGGRELQAVSPPTSGCSPATPTDLQKKRQNTWICGWQSLNFPKATHRRALPRLASARRATCETRPKQHV